MLLIAPAKLNLCLYLGSAREDGLHELCSIFEPLTLVDRIEVSESDRDDVICEGVEGRNLAVRALAALRERGWDGPPLRLEIEKRIPLAGGLGGGSADAAAVLRLAAGELDGLTELAAAIGADVPSQLDPGFALVGGAGELVEPLPPPGDHALVLLPHSTGLATAEVFAEADRLGLGRVDTELAAHRGRIREAAGSGASPLDYAELLVNDLEPAALSLRPSIAGSLDALRAAGAARALITGSGPTAFGLFADLDTAAEAAGAIGRPEAIVCGPRESP
ncbi:MAG: 4-(cytidine 5'-diphospho)-2-C-methyl-D-erythritol kinase [Actinomycetota bacterium]